MHVCCSTYWIGSSVIGTGLPNLFLRVTWRRGPRPCSVCTARCDSGQQQEINHMLYWRRSSGKSASQRAKKPGQQQSKLASTQDSLCDAILQQQPAWQRSMVPRERRAVPLAGVAMIQRSPLLLPRNVPRNPQTPSHAVLQVLRAASSKVSGY